MFLHWELLIFLDTTQLGWQKGGFLSAPNLHRSPSRPNKNAPWWDQEFLMDHPKDQPLCLVLNFQKKNMEQYRLDNYS